MSVLTVVLIIEGLCTFASLVSLGVVIYNCSKW